MFDYTWIRENDLTSHEFRFLAVVNSFSNESHLKLDDYAKSLGCSDRTIKRIIKSLVEKNFIEVRYGIYKSLHIKIKRDMGVLYESNDAPVKGQWRHAKGPMAPRKRDMGVPFKREEIKKTIKNSGVNNSSHLAAEQPELISWDGLEKNATDLAELHKRIGLKPKDMKDV